ncbi:MAG: hypothetical protein KAH72_00800 [Flavobacteriaceae bacterium]|nr:hypothetical protein [Flavobacteriaceae bacterium]
MADEKEKQKLENPNFLHPKYALSGVGYHFRKGTDEIFHSEDIEKWVKDYFKDNPKSDGIEIVMISETSFTVNHAVITMCFR